jgi:hypothetical protein
LPNWRSRLGYCPKDATTNWGPQFGPATFIWKSAIFNFKFKIKITK